MVELLVLDLASPGYDRQPCRGDGRIVRPRNWDDFWGWFLHVWVQHAIGIGKAVCLLAHMVGRRFARV